jgi:hypothetical protein
MHRLGGDSIAWELNEVEQVHHSRGLKAPTTLTPPQHKSPSNSLLQSSNINAIRVEFEDNNRSKFKKYVDELLKIPIVPEPYNDGNLCQIPVTRNPSLTAIFLPSGQRSPHPTFRMLPIRLRERLHERRLNKSLDMAAKGANIHLWTHLWEFANDVQWPIIEQFLHNVGEKLEDEDIHTMGELPSQ